MNSSVVLITGALSGIGKAAALAFARAGYRVAASGRRDDAGQALAGELRALGAEAEFFRVDVRSDDDLRDLVDRTVARFGHLDVAVNSAGTEGQPGPVTDQTAESYAATFDTNVLGTLLSMKHELRVMQPQGSGSIINVSSTTGHRGSAGASVYTASKHAVEGLTKAGALEAAAFGVRVNAVAPVQSTPSCSPASPAATIERPLWWLAFHSNAPERSRRSPMLSRSLLRTKLRSSPDKSLTSTEELPRHENC
jgi:NAD(P)-dependent dehydrogenase (short-subunit alcohol dehydrogenase family)